MDCAGMDDTCQTRTCMQGKCGKSFAPAGTALPTQTAGDCKKLVCDGNGAAIQANDDTDLPSDGNTCTDDICTAGVPSYPAKANGAGCNDADPCTPTDTCQAGMCTGINPIVCPGGQACFAGACAACGKFGLPEPKVGSQPSSLVGGDLSGDGEPDLAVVNYNSHTVSVLVNNGNGTFAPKVDYP